MILFHSFTHRIPFAPAHRKKRFECDETKHFSWNWFVFISFCAVSFRSSSVVLNIFTQREDMPTLIQIDAHWTLVCLWVRRISQYCTRTHTECCLCSTQTAKIYSIEWYWIEREKMVLQRQRKRCLGTIYRAKCEENKNKLRMSIERRATQCSR